MNKDNLYYETDRLILRTATDKDSDELATKRSTEFVTRYNLYRPCDSDQIRREISECENIVLELKNESTVIGCISIKDDDLRYHIDSKTLTAWLTEDKAYCGYMYEALTVILAEIFYNRAHERVSIQIFSQNTASIKLAEKLGFEQEGYLKRALKNDFGQVFDIVLLSLDSESFKINNPNPFI